MKSIYGGTIILRVSAKKITYNIELNNEILLFAFFSLIFSSFVGITSTQNAGIALEHAAEMFYYYFFFFSFLFPYLL